RDLKLSWHQDSGRVNWEMEGNPRPRISLKVAFFLTDTSTPDRGNFYVVPGSHKQNEVGLPNENRQVRLPDGVPVLAPRGSAVFFDRRIWHTASANFSPEPRRVLFYGYSYRWLRPRDELTAPGTWEELGPLRSQLFGASPTGGYGYTSPTPADVPLREWIREHAGEAAVAP
ncbi:MAG: phytanoyl-CoA dioxygenase family protein, partial [Armatimonadetes bacterium]|nr:phytanoyl-CoA dioxygenase family protein [Armatimonadota bacterium]